MSISIPIAVEKHWTYTPNLNPDGPMLAVVGDTLRMSRSSSVNARNQWNRVNYRDLTWSSGKYFDFQIQLIKLSTSTEVKIDFPGGVILRHDSDGTTRWVYWTGEFKNIGDSKMSFGDKTNHQIELEYRGDYVEVFEDGRSVGKKPVTSGTVYNAELGFQVLAEGAAMEAEIKHIELLSQKLKGSN